MKKPVVITLTIVGFLLVCTFICLIIYFLSFVSKNVSKNPSDDEIRSSEYEFSDRLSNNSTYTNPKELFGIKRQYINYIEFSNALLSDDSELIKT
ncbi:MAG: hypothetical protein ACRC5M_00430, partial [Anaeroplasmataceae bacterium]